MIKIVHAKQHAKGTRQKFRYIDWRLTEFYLFRHSIVEKGKSRDISFDVGE